MFKPEQLDELAQGIMDFLPEGARQIPQDAKKNLRAMLQNHLQRMNLVTREEFEVQSEVLARTREKLEALEKVVAELEENMR